MLMPSEAVAALSQTDRLCEPSDAERATLPLFLLPCTEIQKKIEMRKKKDHGDAAPPTDGPG